jgi:hypothetical protein
MRRRLSPSLAVAIAAILVAAGVTIAAAASSETATDKKLATKVIKKLAPKLSVKKAKTAGSATNATNADSATTADSADAIGGKTAADLIATGKIVHFSFKLSFGAERAIASSGPLSLTAKCLQNTTSNGGTANQDVSRILIATTQDGAVFDGADAKHGGPLVTDFLNVATAETDRVFAEDNAATGATNYDASSQELGAAMAPDSSAIGLSQDGVAMGENNLGANCVFQGTAVIENG